MYAFEAKSIEGKPVQFEQFKGKVVLIVNVASQCGFTKQYADLEALYKKHKDQGFVILGFPCNQFGSQEPGTEAEIAEFCNRNFGVSFPLFAKVDVNGDSAHPLFKFLKSAQPGFLGTEFIKWNFTKFLVDRSGKVVKRFSPTAKPLDIEEEIKKLL